ncbi:MAG: 1-deoxy-D-xylulose-5-phosphate synthase [Rickettsiaceae bacterium]|nr:1-deoxy-D-xylulose-5-phosphate synthase [Rickettsiaceae bacterium]
MNLLDQISLPSDLKNLSTLQLKQLADELRLATIDAVSQTGGHLGAGLGVVELTIALHYIFDTPNDKLIWDVGHQAYPHKILTGRKNKITTIRQPGGLSGFTKRAESEYDVFGAGHSSTSVSAALGFAVARDIKEEKRNVIAVIGDGAISAGMAYEALNNAGAMHNRLIVILNDNDMSIASPVGAMSNYLSKLAASKSYLKFRGISKKILNKLPGSISKYPKKLEKFTKEWWMGGNIFEEMGFYYIGPIDGHNLDILVPILQNIRDDDSTTPILIHAVTQKGHGYNEVMKSEDRLHAVTKFNPKTGIQDKKPAGNPSYSQIFGRALTEMAKTDDKIVAITAAMPSGTGLDIFAKEFSGKEKPDRFFDVGIAEQHAVTFAAGLACEGIKPFVAIYSTFLQRGYDQVVHDVAVQKLPVRFAIDRAGFVGADGPTHAGCYDIAYLINLPGFVLMAPSNGDELAKMLATAANINDRPSAIRYPRGESALNIDLKNVLALEIGKGKIVQEGSVATILCYGTILENALKAAEILAKNYNLNITIADARFAKPLDQELIFNLAKHHKIFITLEEGVLGGFGSAVMQLLSTNGYLDGSVLKFRQLFMKDEFIEQNSIGAMQDQAGIGADDIVKMISELTKDS